RYAGVVAAVPASHTAAGDDQLVVGQIKSSGHADRINLARGGVTSVRSDQQARPRRHGQAALADITGSGGATGDVERTPSGKASTDNERAAGNHRSVIGEVSANEESVSHSSDEGAGGVEVNVLEIVVGRIADIA